MRSANRAVFAVLAVLGVVGCGGATQASVEHPTPISETTSPGPAAARTIVRRLARRSEAAQLQSGELTPEQQAWAAANCLGGMPVLDPTWGYGPIRLVSREGYALGHSTGDRIPLWVCEGISVAQIAGPLERPSSDPFAPDPALEEGERAELADYSGSGFDRGHLAPSADQTVDEELQRQTFYLSNMAPQVGINFNRHIWAQLEGQARVWLRARGGGFIITGPLFWDPAEEDPSTADGFVDYEVIGPGSVSVPTHFYKIVVACEGGRTEDGECEGDMSAIAFVMSNEAHRPPEGQRAPQIFGPYIRSIDWIEERSGLDFLPDLDAGAAHQLESMASALWE